MDPSDCVCELRNIGSAKNSSQPEEGETSASGDNI